MRKTISVKYLCMERYSTNRLLKYEPYGVWTEKSLLKFYESPLGGSASTVHQLSDRFFEAECLTMQQLMEINKHSEISVFKADIEGAALPILKQMIENEIHPDQIIVEFERPKGNMEEISNFFNDVSSLRKKLIDQGFEEFILPRLSAKYYSLEMLFVNTKKRTK